MKPYKTEKFDASEIVEAITNACNCAYKDGYNKGKADLKKEYEDLIIGISKEDARRIKQETYEKAYREGYDKGYSDGHFLSRIDVINKIRGFIKAEGNPYGKPGMSQEECLKIIRYLDSLKEQKNG